MGVLREGSSFQRCSWRGVLISGRCPHFRGVLREGSSFVLVVVREVSSISWVSLERCPHFRGVLGEGSSFVLVVTC